VGFDCYDAWRRFERPQGRICECRFCFGALGPTRKCGVDLNDEMEVGVDGVVGGWKEDREIF
jgi:hypothetical protein